MRDQPRTLPVALALLAPLWAVCGATEAQPASEVTPMPQTETGAPAPLDPDVAKALAAYDKSRAPADLLAAGDAAARDDGAAPPDLAADPGAGLPRARARLTDWLAILGRIQRDLDPEFDPAHPPTLTISPPGPEGLQYAPGVRPADVADPDLRRRYEQAIVENERRVAMFSMMIKLHEARDILIERAASSLHEAVATLGLPREELAASIAGASLTPEDRSALLEAAR